MTRVITALIGGVLLVSPVQAATLLSESFDDGQSAIESRWASSCNPLLNGPNWTLDTSTKFAGAASLKEFVDGLTNRTPEFNTADCYFDQSHANSDTIFIRWYERTQSGFIYDPSNVKTANVGPCCAYPSWWLGHFQGSQELSAAGQNVNEGGGDPFYTENVSGANTKLDTWECVEFQFTMNTPGVGDGIFRIWVDSTLRAEYTSANFRPGGNTEQFNFFRFYAQHGSGTRWFDELVVSTTRVGCIGGGGGGIDNSNPLGTRKFSPFSHIRRN